MDTCEGCGDTQGPVEPTGSHGSRRNTQPGGWERRGVGIQRDGGREYGGMEAGNGNEAGGEGE